MKRLSASSKSIGGIAVVGCTENEEEDASVGVVVCDSTIVDSVRDAESVVMVRAVNRYGCISESVSVFGIALVVVVVKSCASTSVAVRLGGVGLSFSGCRSP